MTTTTDYKAEAAELAANAAITPREGPWDPPLWTVDPPGIPSCTFDVHATSEDEARTASVDAIAGYLAAAANGD